MSRVIKIKRGVDIKLEGVAEKNISETAVSDIYALKPSDFNGLIPKLLLREGDEVKAGTAVFYDKHNDKIRFTAPVSGEIVEIKRGAKRKIMEVKILADKTLRYEEHGALDLASANRQAIIEKMLNMGLWPFIVQRPYGIIAEPEDVPRDIYITGFDSAPLAPDFDFALAGEVENIQFAVNALAKLTDGKVHLGLRPGSESIFSQITGVEKHQFAGPHPAGNVGVQIHHTNPINKGDTVWTLSGYDLAVIGKSLRSGRFQAERVIALAGSEVARPQYYKTRIGASLKSIVKDNLNASGDIRIISGNVLTGSAEKEEGYLSFFSNMVTVIPEGNHKKFFLTEGWLAPGFSKFSLNHSYPTWMNMNKRYKVDTNLNGERRAFVVTGELENVFPFDIYPMQLIKAIMINDLDLMEKLGMYEVIDEDFALCEFACTSKIEIQEVVRQGLETMRKEFA